MVSETQEATRKTVTATVDGTETSGSGGLVVICTIKEIDSRFTTKFYNLKDAEVEELPRGATLRIVVERGGLKKDKDGNIKPGNYPNEFFWNYMGLAGDQEIPATPPPPIVTPAGDARQASIERQVAFKEAVSIVARMNPTAETGWWDSIFLATNIGETILNRTYGHEGLAEKLNEWIKLIGAYTPSADVKEPDDEPEVPKEKDDDHLF